MKYLVKNNVFALGKLNKAGTVIDIDEKDELYFKAFIEKIETEKKTEGIENEPKKKPKKKAVKYADNN